MTDPVEHDLELTTSALKAGPTDLGFAGGVLEIERWQDRLDESDAPALQELGAALAGERGGAGPARRERRTRAAGARRGTGGAAWRAGERRAGPGGARRPDAAARVD